MDRDWIVREVFKHKQRTCVVVEMLMPFFGNYCTGYVSTLKRNKQKHYDDFIGKINTDELTYSGELNYLKDNTIPKELWFLGFDSAHNWNEQNPHTKTFISVKNRTIDLAKEMIKNRI